MSGIVEALRRAASATGSTVELQSARGGDVFTQSRAAEVKDADFRMRQKWMAEHVALLSDVDAMKWAVAQKEEGNRLFRDGQLPAACDAYLFALLGLRAEACGPVDTNTQQFSVEQTSTIQAPVLCNLAACKLALTEYAAAEELCSVVLALSEDGVPHPLRFKALIRRCKARLLSGNFGGASVDCQAAQALAASLAVPEHLAQATRLQREVARQRGVTTRRQQAQQVSWSKSLQEVDLYADKPIAAQGASTDYHSDNSEEDSVVEGGGAEDTGAVSSLCQRLMQWLFGRLKHRKAS